MPMLALSVELPTAVAESREAQHLEHALGDHLGAGVEGRALDEYNELVATEPRRGVALPHDAGQALGDDPQQLVAGGVAELSLTCLKPSMST